MRGLLSPRGLTVLAPLRRVKPFEPLYLTNYVDHSDFVDASTSTGKRVTVNSSSTNNAKGSWTEIWASTPVDVFGIEINLASVVATSGSAVHALIDIAIGGSGSEVQIIEGINVGYGFTATRIIEIPIFIPKGTRVAARMQANPGSKTAILEVRPRTKRGYVTPARYTTSYGVDLTQSRGTVVTAGTHDIEPAWTQITAATTERLAAIAVQISYGGSITLFSSAYNLLDIGVGSSGQERVIAHNILVGGEADETSRIGGEPTLLGASIPSGTRIVARHTRSNTINLDVLIIGIPWRI